MGKFRLGVLFILFSLNLGSTELTAGACPSLLKKFATETKYRRPVLLATALIMAGTFGQKVVYDPLAAIEGKTHEGSGIFFDPEKLFNEVLSAESLRFINDPQNSKIEVAERLTKDISGGYDRAFLEKNPIFPAPRDVSSYFDKKVENRGICRDKCIALAATLEHLGIKAELRSASKTEIQPYGHFWIYLPEFDKVLDPTMAEFGFKAHDATWYEHQLTESGFKIDDQSLIRNIYEYVKRGYRR